MGVELEKDLNEILDGVEQLKAMEKSVNDFATSLKKKQDDFMIKHLGFEKDAKGITFWQVLKKMAVKERSRIIT